jgi:hypothetical protein
VPSCLNLRHHSGILSERQEIHEKRVRIIADSRIRIEYLRIEVGSVTASVSYLGSPVMILWVTSSNSMTNQLRSAMIQRCKQF